MSIAQTKPVNQIVVKLLEWDDWGEKEEDVVFDLSNIDTDTIEQCMTTNGEPFTRFKVKKYLRKHWPVWLYVIIKQSKSEILDLINEAKGNDKDSD